LIKSKIEIVFIKIILSYIVEKGMSYNPGTPATPGYGIPPTPGPMYGDLPPATPGPIYGNSGASYRYFTIPLKSLYNLLKLCSCNSRASNKLRTYSRASKQYARASIKRSRISKANERGRPAATVCSIRVSASHATIRDGQWRPEPPNSKYR